MRPADAMRRGLPAARSNGRLTAVSAHARGAHPQAGLFHPETP
jgi:hypothetical protein